MRIFHIDLRSLDADYATLRYGWENPNAFESRRLPLAEIQDLIDRMELGYYTALPEDYANTGQRLYQWLDGSDRWLEQHLENATEGVVLAIATEAKLGHLPWEVLHDGNSFLVVRPFPVVLPVRWQGDQHLTWADSQAVPNRPLQALFMATSPLGVEPVLNFEAEEGRILAATQRQPMTLQVEESGCLEELEDLLTCYEPGHFDVVHLTGHAWIGDDGPRFITESETGARVDASPQDIAKALQFRFPALLFLSGCRTGQAGKGGEVPSMAGALIAQGAKAVLGWGRPVLDTDGILAAEQLYKALAGAKTLPEALALTYQAMIAAKARDWHLLRLYVTGAVPQNLVTHKKAKGRKAAPKASMTTDFLDTAGKVKVPGRGSFVGRRRPLQNCLRALQDPEQLGVLLTGMGGLGKSSLAARLCDRLVDYERVVLFGALDGAGLVKLLADAVQDAELRQRLQDPNELLKFRLRELFQTETEPTFLLVLDDFEANLETIAGAGGDGFRLTAAAAEVLTALVWALEEAALGHRVVITCRYAFEFTGLVKFYRQPLAGLKQADLQKKCQQLAAFGQKSAIEKEVRERALTLADGNPRLLEWLDKVLRSPGELSVAALLDALAGERKEELREQVLAAALVDQVDAPMRAMLERALVYELPVPRAAVVAVCEGVDAVETLIARAVALGLLEQSPDEALRVPRVLPLAVSEDELLAARAAQALYRSWWEEAESSSELQKLEIHRLAVLGESGDILGEITDSLAGRWNSKGRFREVISLCDTTLQKCENHRILLRLAWAQDDLGKTTECLENYQKALKVCPDDDIKIKSGILNNLAIVVANQGDIDGAIDLYQQSLELAERIGDEQGKSITVHNLADLKAQQGNVENALTLYQQSLKIKEKIGYPQGKSVTLHGIAGVKAQQGDVDGAIDLYQQSLDITEEIGDVKTKAATLHQMALLKAQQGDIEGAIALYQQSLDIEEKIGNAQGMAATLHQMAGLKAQQGDIEGAITLYQQSLDFGENIGNMQGKAPTLRRLGGIYQLKGNIETAQDLFRQSLEIEEELGNTKGKSESLDWIANLKAQQGDVDGAIALYQQSLDIKEKIGYEQSKATTLHGIANLKAQQGDVDGAIALYQQSLDIKEKIGDAQGKAATLAMLGQLLADAKGDTATAIDYLNQSLTILKKISPPNARIVQEILDRLSG